MKLIQLSRTLCPPCNASKEYIETLDQGDYQYEYINMDDSDNHALYKDLMMSLPYKSYPIFIVTKEFTILDHWSGYTPGRLKNFFKGKLHDNQSIQNPMETSSGEISDRGASSNMREREVQAE